MLYFFHFFLLKGWSKPPAGSLRCISPKNDNIYYSLYKTKIRRQIVAWHNYWFINLRSVPLLSCRRSFFAVLYKALWSYAVIYNRLIWRIDSEWERPVKMKYHYSKLICIVDTIKCRTLTVCLMSRPEAQTGHAPVFVFNNRSSFLSGFITASKIKVFPSLLSITVG